MLEIVIPSTELWDEKNEQFIYTNEQKLQLEHSLVSLSEWESRWCKPFIGKKDKTKEQIIDYIKCMTITQNVKDECYDYLTTENIEQIDNYIAKPMTATWFRENKNTANVKRRPITAELIYCWMIAFDIPIQCEKWHLNKLLTLIRVCNEENRPQDKKISKQELMKQHSAINATNRKRFNSKG